MSRRVFGNSLQCNYCKFLMKRKRFSCLKYKYYSSSWFFGNGNNLQNAINNAERLVGYPTTYSSLKHLVDEEPANFLSLAKKLVGSGHPLLTTARDILSQDPYSSHHLGGLWVLLLAKASGNNDERLLAEEFVQGIHPKQRILAETTELIYTAFLIHRSMLDVANKEYLHDLNKKTLNFGNKLSVLGGDFLLAKAALELAKLENTEVVELIGTSIGDLSEGAIMDAKSVGSGAWDIKSWEKFIYLLQGSVMANSCRAATLLTGHTAEIQESAFTFGEHLIYGQKCYEDMETFPNKKLMLKKTNIMVVMAFNKSTSLKEKYGNADKYDLSTSKDLKQDILIEVPTILEETKQMYERYITTCKHQLRKFKDLETVSVISSILNTIHEN